MNKAGDLLRLLLKEKEKEYFWNIFQCIPAGNLGPLKDLFKKRGKWRGTSFFK